MKRDQLNLKIMKTKLFITAFVLMASVVFGKDSWVLDKAHTEVKFNVQHLVISEVGGHFKEFDGSVTSSNADFDGSQIDFTAMVPSIHTGNEQRDKHLKSDDFFNAEEYPELKFNGTLVKKGDDYVMQGEMTIRGKTHPVEFDVEYNGTVKDPWGNEKAGFKIMGKINRFDYGLQWNTLMEAGGAVVDEEVEIVCNVQLQKQA